jgi:hypothetical protein
MKTGKKFEIKERNLSRDSKTEPSMILAFQQRSS